MLVVEGVSRGGRGGRLQSHVHSCCIRFVFVVSQSQVCVCRDQHPSHSQCVQNSASDHFFFLCCIRLFLFSRDRGSRRSKIKMNSAAGRGKGQKFGVRRGRVWL